VAGTLPSPSWLKGLACGRFSSKFDPTLSATWFATYIKFSVVISNNQNT
jgi:hypothetical protein